MKKYLLSIDWDYFICTKSGNMGSYAENKKTIIDLWYKRYIKLNNNGKNIQKYFKLSANADQFWDRIKQIFQFDENVKFYVSDSHALSYQIAEENDCNSVYLFDAHSDLGYGGLSALNFEVNCANWLGKLLKSHQVNDASIIYSPYSMEKPEHFSAMNSLYQIRYPMPNDLNAGIHVDALHVCRSGAWTPPWFDDQFMNFVNKPDIPYQFIDCPERKWDTEHISFSDQINYMLA